MVGVTKFKYQSDVVSFTNPAMLLQLVLVGNMTITTWQRLNILIKFILHSYSRYSLIREYLFRGRKVIPTSTQFQIQSMTIGRCATYKRFLRTATADANGSLLLQEIEVLFLELEALNTTLQSHQGWQLWPVRHRLRLIHMARLSVWN